MIRTHTRPGATLTEVLVAIFVMAIGLLALLTLFPLGALSMAQAIKDDRTAHSAKNGFAIAQVFQIQTDQVVTNSGKLQTGAVYPGNSPVYFFNPYPGIPQSFTGTAGFLLAPDLKMIPGYDGPSYPVYVDPWGWNYFQTMAQLHPNLNPTPPVNSVPSVNYWVLGYQPPTPLPPQPPSPPSPPLLPISPYFPANPPGLMYNYSSIPRVPLSTLPSTGLALGNSAQWLDRWCTLTDDITFSAGKSPTEPADAGLPSLGTGAVQRENRYTWAWLARLPNITDPTQVDTQVVVYSGRSVTSVGETAYPSVIFGGYWDVTQATPLVPTKTFVDVPYPSGKRPNVRTGTWILDATMCYWDPTRVPPSTVPDPHGYFYRVVGVTELGPLPTLTSVPAGPYPPGSLGLRLEIQGSFKNPNPTYWPVPPVAGQPYGVLIVMENVAEVF
jgi:hypothetical protein